MSVIHQDDGQIGLVYSATTKIEGYDAIKTAVLSKKFLEGLVHFAKKPKDEEIEALRTKVDYS